MIIQHKEWKCKVQFGKYLNGNTVIQLVDSQDGELVAIASVNGEFELHESVVGIKTWSENEGIVQSLVDGNVIKPQLLGGEPSGFVVIEHYELTDEAYAELKKQSAGTDR